MTKKFRFSLLLNHLTLRQLIEFSNKSPNAILEVNDGVAEWLLLEIEKTGKVKKG